MTRVVMSLVILVTTGAVVAGYLYSDQTPKTMIQFIVLYLVGVVWPGIWTVQLHRRLAPVRSANASARVVTGDGR